MTNMRMTGQNLLYALGISCALVFCMSAMFIVITAIHRNVEPQNDMGIHYGYAFIDVFTGALFCYGPFIFVPSFALLQRFRIKK